MAEREPPRNLWGGFAPDTSLPGPSVTGRLREEVRTERGRANKAEQQRDILTERLRERFAHNLAATIDADLAAAHAKGTTYATAALQIAVVALDKALEDRRGE